MRCRLANLLPVFSPCAATSAPRRLLTNAKDNRSCIPYTASTMQDNLLLVAGYNGWTRETESDSHYLRTVRFYSVHFRFYLRPNHRRYPLGGGASCRPQDGRRSPGQDHKTESQSGKQKLPGSQCRHDQTGGRAGATCVSAWWPRMGTNRTVPYVVRGLNHMLISNH